MKAIIIGGGIGGLSTGIALRQAGVDIEIYERAKEVREVGAGLAIWPNATRALTKLGLNTAIEALSIPQLGGGIHTWKGEMLVGQSGEDLKKRYGVPVIVAHRAELLTALGDDLPAETVRLNTAFTRFEQDSDGVTAHFADGTSAHGDLLIAADGIKSAVRLQIFPDSQPRYSGYTAWRGVAPFNHNATDNYWGESWGTGRRFGLAPLNKNRAYWFATHNAPEGHIIPATERKAYVSSLFKGWHHPIEALIEATPESAILQNDIHDIAPLKTWIQGRAVLMGDAAHAMTPNLGQGACQALEDAVALGAAFTNASDINAALQAYQSQRLARANGILTQSGRIGQVGQLSNPLLCWLRDRAVKLTASMQTRQMDSVVGYTV